VERERLILGGNHRSAKPPEGSWGDQNKATPGTGGVTGVGQIGGDLAGAPIESLRAPGLVTQVG